MKVKYNDNDKHWLDVETCTYYMHPVFKLWFSDGTTTKKDSFSFDDSGKATIYFSVHIAGAPDASHPNGTTRTPNSGAYPGDPDMNIPTAGITYNQTQWNASGCVLQITNASDHLSFKCDGVIDYTVLTINDSSSSVINIPADNVAVVTNINTSISEGVVYE